MCVCVCGCVCVCVLVVQKNSSTTSGTRRGNKSGNYQQQTLAGGVVVMVPKHVNFSDFRKRETSLFSRFENGKNLGESSIGLTFNPHSDIVSTVCIQRMSDQNAILGRTRKSCALYFI